MTRRAAAFCAVMVIIALPMQALAAASNAKPSGTSQSKSAATGNQDATNQVIQGYGSTQPLLAGMIVKLADKDASKVEPCTLDSITKMMGVVVQPNDAAFALGNAGNAGQVFVANSGRYEVLVSNQNGPISTGDYITISSIAGIASKADTTQSPVLGRAGSGFDGTAGVVSTATLKDAKGAQVKISIGRIPVQVSIGANPNKDIGAKYVPAPLRTMADAVSGKPTSAIKIYLGLTILVLASIIAGAMLYSGIRGGLIAVGRNPMARKQIIAGMIRVILMGVILFMLGIFGVYLMLKL